jgi:hypothetical protein
VKSDVYLVFYEFNEVYAQRKKLQYPPAWDKTDTVDNKFLVCLVCMSSFKLDKCCSTTSLRRHLLTFHPEKWNEIINSATVYHRLERRLLNTFSPL